MFLDYLFCVVIVFGNPRMENVFTSHNLNYVGTPKDEVFTVE